MRQLYSLEHGNGRSAGCNPSADEGSIPSSSTIFAARRDPAPWAPRPALRSPSGLFARDGKATRATSAMLGCRPEAPFRSTGGAGSSYLCDARRDPAPWAPRPALRSPSGLFARDGKATRATSAMLGCWPEAPFRPTGKAGSAYLSDTRRNPAPWVPRPAGREGSQ